MDKVGQRFGRLVVLENAEDYIDAKGRRRKMCKCKCDCGNIVVVREDSLVPSETRSCGCYHREVMSYYGKINGSKIKYGESRERLHNIWYLMKYRCENEEAAVYDRYGGRGIKVCDEWNGGEEGYFNFKEWALTNGYADTLTIDRIDNDSDYSPDNCRWVDAKTQNNNKRSNKNITYNGETHNVSQWAEILKMPMKVLHARLFRYKWSVERAFTQPLRRSSRNVCEQN